jgi:hypothetical protein
MLIDKKGRGGGGGDQAGYANNKNAPGNLFRSEE